ncbi:MAG: fused MFS/spermidine synthase, partial [Deltaproteobacteria bacterium]
LLITALGTLTAKWVKPVSLRLYGFLALVIGVWPLVQMIGIRGFRDSFFAHGVSPGFYPILFYIVVTITPYCLLAGFFLPHSQYLLNRRGYPFESGSLYVIDSIGDITGGLIFSFILVYWLKPFMTLTIGSSSLILVGFFILWKRRSAIVLVAGLVISLGFYVFSLNTHFEEWTLSDQYGQIVRYLESPYGRIVISKEGPQHTLWESGVPLYWGSNIGSSEEKIHYPLSQVTRVKDVLLVSGGLGRTLREVAKYRPSRVDYLELDPRLTDAAAQVGLIRQAPFLRIIHEDARRHLKEMEDSHYDAVIMDLPEPETFQVNRFFTDEFFALVKPVLKKGGVFSFNMAYSPNYMSEVQKKKLSTVFNTARRHFRHVTIIPGEAAYFLMSDRALSTDIPSLLEEKTISTVFIKGFYQGNVTEERIKAIQEGLDRKEPVNRDFEPRLMNLAFAEWFSA